jgi:hypothetical protein
MKTESVEIQQFLAERRREALTIDPDTAEVALFCVAKGDEYGVDPDGAEEPWVGLINQYFARRPGSNKWVWFGDLADATRKKLERPEPAFPEGVKKSMNGMNRTPHCPWRAAVTYQMAAGPLELEYCLEEAEESLQLLKHIPNGAFIKAFKVFPSSPED